MFDILFRYIIESRVLLALVKDDNIFCTESNKLSAVCPRYKRNQGAELGWVGEVRSKLATVVKGSSFDSVNKVQRKSIVAREGFGKKKCFVSVLKYWDMFICIWE